MRTKVRHLVLGLVLGCLVLAFACAAPQSFAPSIGSAHVTTTVTNQGAQCFTPFITCNKLPVSDGSRLSFYAGPLFAYVGQSGAFTGWITVEGATYSDFQGTLTYTGSGYYTLQGTYNHGKGNTTQTLHVFCRAGRVGGCAWYDASGSATL
jgi:hypothetical protein